MTDAAAPPSAAEHQPFSLSDLLSSNLPTCARRALYSRLAIYGLSCIKNARLACRGLRQLIDEQIPGVCLHLDTFSPGDLAAFGADGRWLQRRPAVSKVTLVASEAVAAECIALPFGGATCLRVKELAVRIGYPSQHSSGAALFALLSRLPALTALTLNNLLLREGPAHATLATCALDSLPQLTSLTLGCSRLAGCIGPSLAARLTHLVLNTVLRGDLASQQAVVACALVPRLTAVRELELVVNSDHPFTPVDLRVMLDALPASAHVDTCAEVTCRLASGELTCVQLGLESGGPYEDDVWNLLTTAFLPSRVLGPRLPLFHQRYVWVSADPAPVPALVTQFFSRCDDVRTEELEGASADAVSTAARRTGVPETLMLRGALQGDVGLHAPGPADPARLGSLFDQPPAQAVPEVVRRALQVLQRAGEEATASCSCLILTGHALRLHLGCRPALGAWVQALARQAEQQAVGGAELAVSGYQALPYGSGALVLDCRTEAAADAVAAAATETLLLGGGPLQGDLQGTLLHAAKSSQGFGDAAAEVLQSAWYASSGDGGGGGGEAAGGGAAGSSRDAGRLQRLRWLLEVWEELQRDAARLER